MDSYNGGEDSRKEIEKVLMERAYSLSRTSACRGKVSGNGFDENGKYKLYIQGNDYCIERDIDSDGIQKEDSSVLQKWASEEKKF